jgi:hypothetical protein
VLDGEVISDVAERTSVALGVRADSASSRTHGDHRERHGGVRARRRPHAVVRARNPAGRGPRALGLSSWALPGVWLTASVVVPSAAAAYLAWRGSPSAPRAVMVASTLLAVELLVQIPSSASTACRRRWPHRRYRGGPGLARPSDLVTVDRLRRADLTMLLTDRGRVPMNTGAVLVFDGGPFETDLAALLTDRVNRPPLGAASPSGLTIPVSGLRTIWCPARSRTRPTGRPCSTTRPRRAVIPMAVNPGNVGCLVRRPVVRGRPRRHRRRRSMRRAGFDQLTGLLSEALVRLCALQDLGNLAVPGTSVRGRCATRPRSPRNGA